MFWGFACQDCMVFQTRLGYRKKISGPICRTGEGRIYIKVVILLFNAFQWFVKSLNPVASLDFNYELLKEHLFTETKTRQTVQLRTSKIHNARQQAGGLEPFFSNRYNLGTGVCLLSCAGV